MADGTVSFLKRDAARWLFPLHAPAAFAEADPAALRAHIAEGIFNTKTADGFVAGHVAFARKDEYHLRRAFVLDPISTFYLFDFVWKHRDRFSAVRTGPRRCFGPAFSERRPVKAFDDYHAFRRAKYALQAAHHSFCQADIFNCFNSFYHHRVTNFVASVVDTDAGNAFGQFLRELNAGDSIACFPQGLYPAKVIGNSYLGFIEKSRGIRSDALIRYLDDIVMVGDSTQACADMLLELQHALDEHHLALNDAKTRLMDSDTEHDESGLDEIKRNLLQKRERVASYDRGEDDEDEDEDEDEVVLDDEEREYLLDLIRRPNVAQEDVELALSLMEQEPDGVDVLVDLVIDGAPHLLRQLHRFVGNTGRDDALLWTALTDRLSSSRPMSEYDLFWVTRMLIDYYDLDQDLADVLHAVYERKEATRLVRATILECEHLDHGLGDMKRKLVRDGGHLLELAGALYGLRKLNKAPRNQAFKYAKRHGSHHAVLADIALSF